MRFQEAYETWQEKRLEQEEAAMILGVCSRTFRRYIDRYEEEGLEGLKDKRLTPEAGGKVDKNNPTQFGRAI